jgi:hypothetical protein
MVELDEIKEVVSKKTIVEQLGAEPLPHEIVDLEKMIKDPSLSSPVFIKMDKYKDILQKIHDLKISINKIEDVLRVRKNMHEINMRSDIMLEKTFQEFADATNDFKREFVVAKSLPFYPEQGQREENEHVAKLSKEIHALKQELEDLEI